MYVWNIARVYLFLFTAVVCDKSNVYELTSNFQPAAVINSLVHTNLWQRGMYFLSSHRAVVFEIFEIFSSCAENNDSKCPPLVIIRSGESAANYFRELKFKKYPRDIKRFLKPEKRVDEKIKIILPTKNSGRPIVLNFPAHIDCYCTPRQEKNI